MKIDRETLTRLVALARRAEPISPSESRAVQDAERALLDDFEAQFPVEHPGPIVGERYTQPTLFDPTPYEV